MDQFSAPSSPQPVPGSSLGIIATAGPAGRRGSMTTIACEPCRRRKSKCNGVRPVCGTCTSKKTPCKYDMKPEERWQCSLRKRVKGLETGMEQVKSLAILLSSALDEKTAIEINRAVKDDRVSPELIIKIKGLLSSKTSAATSTTHGHTLAPGRPPGARGNSFSSSPASLDGSKIEDPTNRTDRKPQVPRDSVVDFSDSSISLPEWPNSPSTVNNAPRSLVTYALTIGSSLRDQPDEFGFDPPPRADISSPQIADGCQTTVQSSFTTVQSSFSKMSSKPARHTSYPQGVVAIQNTRAGNEASEDTVISIGIATEHAHRVHSSMQVQEDMSLLNCMKVDGYHFNMHGQQAVDLEVPIHLIQPMDFESSIPYAELLHSDVSPAAKFRAKGHLLIAQGFDANELIGEAEVDMMSFLQPQDPGEARTVAAWAAGHAASLEALPLPERLASCWKLMLFMRWQIFPTEVTYQDMPWWLRPVRTQNLVFHQSIVDTLPWPGVRDAFIQEPSDHALRIHQAVSVSWPHEAQDMVVHRDGVLKMSQQFEQHIRDINNWTLDRKMLAQFPHLAGRANFGDTA